jgi:phytoene synthase
MTLSATARSACETLALVPGSEFESVFRFLPSEDQDWLLSLEALFRSLRDIPLGVSDPSVGVAKLAWWQQELARAPDEGSQHPVVRALLDTGALEAMNGDDFGDYLHALVTELQEEPVTDVELLRDRLAGTAGAEARLLAGHGGFSDSQLRAAGAASRLLELMRTLANGGAARSRGRRSRGPGAILARDGAIDPGGRADPG